MKYLEEVENERIINCTNMAMIIFELLANTQKYTKSTIT